MRASARTGGRNAFARSAVVRAPACIGGRRGAARSAAVRASVHTGGRRAAARSAVVRASACTGGRSANTRSAVVQASAPMGGGRTDARSALVPERASEARGAHPDKSSGAHPADDGQLVGEEVIIHQLADSEARESVRGEAILYGYHEAVRTVLETGGQGRRLHVPPMRRPQLLEVEKAGPGFKGHTPAQERQRTWRAERVKRAEPTQRT